MKASGWLWINLVSTALIAVAGCSKEAPKARQPTNQPAPAAVKQKAKSANTGGASGVTVANGSATSSGQTAGEKSTPPPEPKPSETLQAQLIANRQMPLQNVRTILDRGLDVNAPDKDGRTPLLTAIYLKREDVAKLLLARGARIKTEHYHDDPFIAACRHSSLSLIEAMLNSGADVNTSRDGYTGLHAAAQKGRIEVVKFLLSRGADIHAKSGDWTVLHAACQGDNKDLVTFLLGKGMDVNATNNDKGTPLHEASFKEHHEIVSALLAHGASVNARDDLGRTPLYIAALGGNEKTVELLVNAGADVNAADKWGRTPTLLAADKGHDAIVATLKAHGGHE